MEKKDLMFCMRGIALETMHSTQEDDLFLSVGEWYESLQPDQQNLLESTRALPEEYRSGEGLRLLRREEALRLQTIAWNEKNHKRN